MSIVCRYVMERTELYRNHAPDDESLTVSDGTWMCFVELDCTISVLSIRPAPLPPAARDAVYTWEVAPLTREAANSLLDRVAPIAEKLRTKNHKLKPPPIEDLDIYNLCAAYSEDPENLLVIWEAAYYCQDLDDLRLRADMTNQDIYDLADELRKDALSNGIDVLEHVEVYLKRLVNQLKEKQRESENEITDPDIEKPS